MMNHATTEVFFDNLKVPAENLIGEEGQGFRYILSGMNAERILIAVRMHRRRQMVHREGVGLCQGARGVRPADRPEPGHPVPDRQGLRADARRRTDGAGSARNCSKPGEHCGAEANMAKMLAAEASWAAANVCVQTHGGFGFAEEYDIERKFRETRLYQVAPISTNLILTYHRRARARPAAVVLRTDMLPLEGISRRRHRAGGGSAVLLGAPGGCRRRGHQDRAARRRFRARLRRRLPWARAAISSGSTAASSRSRSISRTKGGPISSRRCCRRRCADAESEARRNGQARLLARAAAQGLSGAHLLHHHRLWRRGPHGDRKAYDLLIQAESGPCSITGGPKGPSRRRHFRRRYLDRRHRACRNPRSADPRTRTGEGADIRISMFDVMADWLAVPLINSEAGKPPRRIGLAHPSIAPYGVFQPRTARTS